MARIYVGNLPIDIKEREIDDLFYKYGRIKDIDVKMPARPPAFAFVAFMDARDAEDAVRGRDGYQFDGQRLRCEIAKGDRGGGGGGGRDRFDDRRDERPRGRTGGRRTDYGVVVSNLPKSCSWQDLKDYMRKAGDVVFTDVDNRTMDGIVEFANREDMENAIRKLDDTEMKNPFDATFIRVKSSKGGKDDSRDRKDSKRRDSRSRSRSRSDSRSRSRSAGRDDKGRDRPSRKKDRSHSRSRSDSRSRSRSRSPSSSSEKGKGKKDKKSSRERDRDDESRSKDDVEKEVEKKKNGRSHDRDDDDRSAGDREGNGTTEDEERE